MNAANTHPVEGSEQPGALLERSAEAPPQLTGPTPDLVPRAAPINLSLSADGLLLVGVAGWLVWRRFLRELVLRRVGALLGEEHDARYVLELLAQVAALTGATRVAVGSFYNPRMSIDGYGFTRVTIVSCYVARGRLPLDLQTRDMLLDRIRGDVDDLLRNAPCGWRLVRAGPHLPTACRDYLLRNNIVFMYGRLVMLGGLPVGIINIQFDDPDHPPTDPSSVPHAARLEHLYLELSRVVRGRMLRPPIWQRLFNAWTAQ